MRRRLADDRGLYHDHVVDIQDGQDECGIELNYFSHASEKSDAVVYAFFAERVQFAKPRITEDACCLV